MAIKAVLFDLDGVLVDTETIYTDFWSEIDRLYPTGVADFAHVIKGSTLTSILATYFPNPEVSARIVEMLREHELNMPYRLFDGVAEMLTALHEAGIATAIVTSSNRTKMKHLFGVQPILNQLIATLITDEDVTASKPDPQGYLLAASRLGFAPEECVVVEDSYAGLEAGRRAGGAVIGIATTNPRAEVEKRCDIALDTAAEITVEMLKRL